MGCIAAAAVPQLKIFQNFHPMNNTSHGQLREGVRSLQMNLIAKHHQDVSSFTNCHQPDQEPSDYREKQDVVSFLLRAFTYVKASAVAAKLLKAGFAAQRAEQGRGAWSSPHVTVPLPAQCLVWTGPLAGEPKASRRQ